jgi:hypothetical protein
MVMSSVHREQLSSSRLFITPLFFAAENLFFMLLELYGLYSLWFLPAFPMLFLVREAALVGFSITLALSQD